jgi:hypothetical protein
MDRPQAMSRKEELEDLMDKTDPSEAKWKQYYAEHSILAEQLGQTPRTSFGNKIDNNLFTPGSKVTSTKDESDVTLAEQSRKDEIEKRRVEELTKNYDNAIKKKDYELAVYWLNGFNDKDIKAKLAALSSTDDLERMVSVAHATLPNGGVALTVPGKELLRIKQGKDPVIFSDPSGKQHTGTERGKWIIDYLQQGVMMRDPKALEIASLIADQSFKLERGHALPGNVGSSHYSFTVGKESELAAKLGITKEEALRIISISRLSLPGDQVLEIDYAGRVGTPENLRTREADAKTQAIVQAGEAGTTSSMAATYAAFQGGNAEEINKAAQIGANLEAGGQPSGHYPQSKRIHNRHLTLIFVLEKWLLPLDQKLRAL